jgi:hypothetical protein
VSRDIYSPFTGRSYPDPAEAAYALAADAMGHFLAGLLAPVSEPGPPYTHTLVPPEPEYDDEGNEVWREPDPAFTLTDGGGD